MKNLLPLFIIFALLAACKGKTTKKDEIKDLISTTDPAADTIKKGSKNDTSNVTVELIRQNLPTILAKNDLAAMTTDDRKFNYSEYDLNGDGKKEIFVGFKNSYFCGNAGCNVLLLSSEGKKITLFTIVETPIVIATTQTKGYNDLVITSRGVNYLVRWNGSAYPSNPSVQSKFTGTVENSAVKVLNEETAYSF